MEEKLNKRKAQSLVTVGLSACVLIAAIIMLVIH